MENINSQAIVPLESGGAKQSNSFTKRIQSLVVRLNQRDTQPEASRLPSVDGGGSSETGDVNFPKIHGDLEEGMKNSLDKKLVEMVKTGNSPGIKLALKELGWTWKQAGKVMGQEIQLTDEARETLVGKIKGIFSDNFNSGLESMISTLGYSVGIANITVISRGRKDLEDFFQMASEFDIELQPVKDETLKAFEAAIDNNLLKGLHYLISNVGDAVKGGLLSTLEYNQKKIDEWINLMGERGWMVIDKPFIEPVIQEEKEGVVVREINRDEIKHLIGKQILENLVEGSSAISGLMGFIIESGLANEKSIPEKRKDVERFIEIAKQNGLIYENMPATPEEKRPSDKFDPNEIYVHFDNAVKAGIPLGITGLEEKHLAAIREGRVYHMRSALDKIPFYFKLAHEFDVFVDERRVNEIISSQFSSDNLQQGVKFHLDNIRANIRREHMFSQTNFAVSSAQSYMDFLVERHLDSLVDLSELKNYMTEVGVDRPQLEG